LKFVGMKGKNWNFRVSCTSKDLLFMKCCIVLGYIFSNRSARLCACQGVCTRAQGHSGTCENWKKSSGSVAVTMLFANQDTCNIGVWSSRTWRAVWGRDCHRNNTGWERRTGPGRYMAWTALPIGCQGMRKVKLANLYWLGIAKTTLDCSSRSLNFCPMYYLKRLLHYQVMVFLLVLEQLCCKRREFGIIYIYIYIVCSVLSVSNKISLIQIQFRFTLNKFRFNVN
jgi:hypothetical protein